MIRLGSTVWLIDMVRLPVNGPVPGQPQQPRLQFERNDAPRAGPELVWQRLIWK